MNKEKNKRVVISLKWIERLKHYTDRVENTIQNDIEHKTAVIALLGYLESLEFIIKD